MRWIKVSFEGGLGNQLFQYATAKALATPGGSLLFDLARYENDYLNRAFRLSEYRIKGSVVSNTFAKSLFTPNTRLNNVVSRLGWFQEIGEEGFVIHEGIRNQLRTFTALRGYWQTEVYFKHIRATLLREVVPRRIPKRPPFLELPNTVAVHVRRSDYLSDARYGFVGERYYGDAIDQLRAILQHPLFIIFSDDLDWCRKQFTGREYVFADDADWKEDHLQLYLIAQCSHQVIANSSFSWWGAWLNRNEEKIVVRPAKPFVDDSLLYEGHYPDAWIAV